MGQTILTYVLKMLLRINIINAINFFFINPATIITYYFLAYDTQLNLRFGT